MTLLLVIIMNALVGACIGLTGIAGFLLPMFYAGFLGLTPIESLALSFAAFIVSGILGCPPIARPAICRCAPARACSPAA